MFSQQKGRALQEYNWRFYNVDENRFLSRGSCRGILRRYSSLSAGKVNKSQIGFKAVCMKYSAVYSERRTKAGIRH